MRVETRSQADYFVRTMKYALEKDDPLSLWEFHTTAMEDVQGGYGIWCKYRGSMTPEQQAAKLMERRLHSDRMKKAYAKKKLLEATRPEVPIRPFPWCPVIA